MKQFLTQPLMVGTEFRLAEDRRRLSHRMIRLQDWLISSLPTALPLAPSERTSKPEPFVLTSIPKFPIVLVYFIVHGCWEGPSTTFKAELRIPIPSLIFFSLFCAFILVNIPSSLGCKSPTYLSPFSSPLLLSS